jgi:hypothetical protein
MSHLGQSRWLAPEPVNSGLPSTPDISLSIGLQIWL